MQATVLATIGRVFWRMAKDRNLDADRLFRDAGVAPARVNTTRERVPNELLWDVCRRLTVLTDDPAIGLDAHRYYHPFDLHALGVTFLASSTLQDALHRLDRYERILSSEIDYSIIDRGQRIDLTCQGALLPEDVQRQFGDLEVSIVVDLCRQGLGRSFDPVEVAFVHAQPDDLTPYQEQFRCQLRFQAPITTISFFKSDLSRPMNASNEDLVDANDRVLDEILASLSGGDLVAKVKTTIIKRLPSGSPAQADIAKLMLTSTRTLSRRLADRGTSFRNLLADVRKQLADKYVRENDKPLTEISYLLGFSDLSSFSRAYKRWFGEAPNSVRTSL